MKLHFPETKPENHMLPRLYKFRNETFGAKLDNKLLKHDIYTTEYQ